jgi:hypothetical protein
MEADMMNIPILAAAFLTVFCPAASFAADAPSVGDGIPVFQTPPDFDSASWNRLLSQAASQGQTQRTTGGDGMPLLYRTLKKVTPDATGGGHQAEYLSIVYLDHPESPQPLHVVAISEKWSRTADGGWSVDKRVYKTHVAGHLVETDGTRIVQKPVLDENGAATGGMEVTDIGYIEMPEPQSPAGLKAWAEKLKEWTSASAR